MSKVAVIVPWRPSEPRRATLWAFVRDWLRRYHGAWPVHTAPGPDGPFNRGAALNQAAAKTDADILVIHDADTICDPLQLSRAVTWVNNYGGICYPYETYTYLDQPSTDWIRSHPTGTWFVSPEVHHTHRGSGPPSATSMSRGLSSSPARPWPPSAASSSCRGGVPRT